jgi:hypothetical protein
MVSLEPKFEYNFAGRARFMLINTETKQVEYCVNVTEEFEAATQEYIENLWRIKNELEAVKCILKSN